MIETIIIFLGIAVAFVFAWVFGSAAKEMDGN